MSVSPKGVKHPPVGWQIDFAPGRRLKILELMNEGKYEFLTVRREFRRPLITGSGQINQVERIILRTELNGVVGYGEIAPWPNFKTESILKCRKLLEDTQKDLGKLIQHIEINKLSFPALRAALSSCRHWSEINEFNKILPCAGLITQPDEFSIRKKQAEGFLTIKLKIDPSKNLDYFRDLLEYIMRCYPAIVLRLDANGSFDFEMAQAWVDWVDSSPMIEFIEQPLPVGHEGYQKLNPAKIALDESFLTPAGMKWTGPIIVKPSLVGDWDEFLKWRESHTGKIVYSSTFETAFGRQGALWLAGHETTMVAAGFDTLNYFMKDSLDQHQPGVFAQGLDCFNWDQLWRSLI